MNHSIIIFQSLFFFYLIKLIIYYLFKILLFGLPHILNISLNESFVLSYLLDDLFVPHKLNTLLNKLASISFIQL